MKKLFVAVIIGLVLFGCTTSPKETKKDDVVGSETITDGVVGYEIFEISAGAQRTDYFFNDLNDDIRSYWHQKLSPNGVEIADANNNTGFYNGIVGGYCWTGAFNLEEQSGEIGKWTLVVVEDTDDNAWAFYYYIETENRDEMPESAYRVVR